MKKTICYFLVLLLTVWLGVTIHRNPGYILIAYNGTSIETSLWFAIIVLLLLFLLLYFLLRFSSGVAAMSSYIKRWVDSRRKRRAQTQTALGLYDLIEGNYSRAEKGLLRSAKDSDMPLVNYLAAALMAEHQHAPKRRDNYLHLAQQLSKDRPLAAGLTRARLQIWHQQWEEASKTLQRLWQLQPKNGLILRLLHQSYLALKDWRSLEKLLPVLRKRKVFSDDGLQQLEKHVYEGLLIAGSKNQTVTVVWNNLSNSLQKEPRLVEIYVKYLLANQQMDDAEEVLKLVLRKTLNKNLLDFYAILPSSQPIKQLMRAEKWLKTAPNNADLLLCLGRLCKQQKLWGKARYYLERSLKLVATPVAYAELGQIMVVQNDLTRALEIYDKGLHLIK